MAREPHLDNIDALLLSVDPLLLHVGRDAKASQQFIDRLLEWSRGRRDWTVALREYVGDGAFPEAAQCLKHMPQGGDDLLAEVRLQFVEWRRRQHAEICR